MSNITHTTLVQTLQNFSGLGQAISAFGNLAITAFIAFRVYRYTKVRDGNEIVDNTWSVQQLMNLEARGSVEHRRISELMIKGGEIVDEDDSDALNYSIFLVLNRIHDIYRTQKSGMFTKAKFKYQVNSTLSLVSAHKLRVSWLLKNRGYPPDFAEAVGKLLITLEPPPPTPRFKEDACRII